jgi:hypothetical protein
MKDQTTGASWIFFALFNLFFTTRRYYLGSLDDIGWDWAGFTGAGYMLYWYVLVCIGMYWFSLAQIRSLYWSVSRVTIQAQYGVQYLNTYTMQTTNTEIIQTEYNVKVLVCIAWEHLWGGEASTGFAFQKRQLRVGDGTVPSLSLNQWTCMHRSIHCYTITISMWPARLVFYTHPTR